MKAANSMLVALAASACAPLQPQAVPATVSLAVGDSARSVVERIVARERLPGYSVTVTIGRVNVAVWHQGVGFADLARKIPATPHTRFRIGSDSKLLTAVALMRMVQDGVLGLDTPIGTYMPELPPAVRPITLRQLAGHQGGIRHYRGSEFFTRSSYGNLRDALRIFINDSLVAPPGTRYSYSSYGFNLIGAVMEARTGKPFSLLMKRYVLDPLGMDETTPDVADGTIANRAALYSIDKDSVSIALADNLSGRWPSGGYLSTTDDLATLGRSILGQGLLSRHSLETC